jgi:Bacterial protein of unknown function (DUF899)
MNTPPIVSREAWEAARQKMLAKEKAAVDALAAEPRRMPWMAVENYLRNFPPGPLPDQTEVPARPAASADTTADTRAGEMAQVGPRVAYEFEGPNGKVSPSTVENHSRVLSRFLIVFCGGLAATLAWLSYGDAARRTIASSYPQLRSLAPTMPQSLDRVVAGQERTRNTDQTATSVDQASSAQADSIPVERRGDAASLQPTVPLKIRPTEARALQTLSEKGKQVSAANQYDASCFPSASAVLQNNPGASPTWTLRAPGHEGTQCWRAAARPNGSDHRPRPGGPNQGKRPSKGETKTDGTTENALSAPPARYAMPPQ